jgi:aspartate/methionine/tyrosine aminotransferase
MSNKISQVLAEIEKDPKYINLIASNFLDFVNNNGTGFNPEFLTGLAKKYFANHNYHPDPKGLLSARSAVSNYYGAEQASVNSDNIIITASTSESYSMIFNNFTNPGDEVLLPNPGYPLFEYLCQYSHLNPKFYHLQQNNSWEIDTTELEKMISKRTKCIVLISPNNPTGSLISQEILNQVVKIAEKNNLFFIFDEVFSEFRDAKFLPRPTPNSGVNIFYLNGISKTLALPDLKMAWIACTGPDVEQSIDKLETSNDTYLNANYLTQSIFPELMQEKENISKRINILLEENRKTLKDFVSANTNIIFCNVGTGGIHNILTINTTTGEEDFVINLLKSQKVGVHPGYFYDLPAGKSTVNIIISLLLTNALFNEGLARILKLFTK